MTDDEIMWGLTRMEQQMIATEFVQVLQRYWTVLYPTLSKYGWWRTPKRDELWLDEFHGARDKWWGRKYVPPEEQDIVIAGELPNGTGFIGRRSQYNAVASAMRRGRTLQTLENVRGSALGTLGWFAYGDAGSDVGAALGRGLGAVGQAGTMRSHYKALSQVPVERTTSGYVAPVRKGTGDDTGTGNTGTGNRLSAPPKSVAVPKAVRPVVPVSGGKPVDVKGTAAKAAEGAIVPARAKGTPGPSAAGSPKPSSTTSASPPPVAPATPAAGATSAPRSLVAKLQSFRINTNDAYTMKKIAEISARNKTPEASLLQARAGSGELRALVREGRGTGVQSVRFLRPGTKKDERTPDIEVTMRDGRKSFVEVRTVTDAGKATQVKHASKVRTPLPDAFEKSIEAKIRHGQISETNPGKIVFHAPFKTINATALEGWRDMLKGMLARGAFPKGLQRIEVTGGTSESILIYQPPDWKGVLVK